MTDRPRIFSGIQPSGDLHIGNYLGAIRNWLELLDRYDGIFCIVDYHAITQPYEVEALQNRIFDAALVYIAAGLEPGRATIFVQSEVPEHVELAWLLSTVTPIGELFRMTQFKDKSQKGEMEAANAGLLNYPILMAADILLYKAVGVPVGEDQVQHLELAREIVRRFNGRFGPVFPEPETLLGEARRVMGLDGERKMSKSLGNHIGLLESEEAIWEKLRPAKTDPARMRRSDPGNPERCNIFSYHRYISPEPDQESCVVGCRTAGIGCIDCKKVLLGHLMALLRPIQERAAALREEPEIVRRALADGAERCRAIAADTMREVRRAMGIR